MATIDFDGGSIEVTERGYATGAVRCIDRSGQARWTAKLPAAESGYMMPLDARAEVLGGMLFVYWNNEHGHAGGAPYFTQLHRILPGGLVAWTRMIDARGTLPTLRLEAGRLGVTCAWAASPFEREGEHREERWLNPETGATAGTGTR